MKLKIISLRVFFLTVTGLLLGLCIAHPAYALNEDVTRQNIQNVLPVNIRTSSNYTINSLVQNNGLDDVFSISSDYGFYVAEGRYELARRISEINAMAALSKVRKEEEFMQALVKAGKAPFEAAWNLLNDPIDTLSGVARGAGKTIERLGGLLSRDRGELEDSRMEELLGVSAMKRKYAHELGVDVYSSNQQLQTMLDEVAWVSFSGAMTTRIVMSLPENDKVTMSLMVGSSVNTLNKIILDKTPEDSRVMNEEKLQAMGVSEALTALFLGHNWYSPRHQTIITLALETMATVRNREEFIRLAVTARTERDAFHYQYIAQLLSAHHVKAVSLSEFFSIGRMVLSLDSKGSAVIAIPYDHVQYTEMTANSIDKIDGVVRAKNHQAGKIVNFIGKVSLQARNMLESKGWTVLEHGAF